jgi:lipopolysaccharide biosynthesis glycosyltransferase
MNCIFICVFNNPNYINMLYILLDSIHSYSSINNKNMDIDIEILIYTSSKFMNTIQQSIFYKALFKIICFEINDNYNTVETACKARLDLFNLGSSKKYSKFLYLDTDIVVKGDLNIVFNLCTKDTLYALEEGSIDSNTDFWGKTLFENAKDLHLYANNFSAFSSGILLFNNCDKMKQLFTIIQADFKKRPFHFYCHDQPYIIYNSFKYELYDNQVLKDVVVNNDHDFSSNKIIHHFPGDPGIHKDKLKFMFAFLNGLKNKN